MAEETLPSVAKSIFVDCKKCGEERYHTVIAHTTATSAKLKCEVCGASKTYKVGAAAKKAKAPKAPKEPKVPGAAKAAREANAKVAKSTAHRSEYEKLVAVNAGDTHKYNMKGNFKANDKLDHPKFGLGVIKSSFVDKIEVIFEDETRSLVHNRQ